jgi:hypothetical protein
MLKFEHLFEEEPPCSDFTVDILEDPPDAKIQFSTSDEGIWVSANSVGYLYLAQIFAELGTRDWGEGTHFHVDRWLKKPEGSKQEVTLEVHNGDWSTDAQA